VRQQKRHTTKAKPRARAQEESRVVAWRARYRSWVLLRREAGELIAATRVRLNGAALGSRDPVRIGKDKIEVDAGVRAAQKVYWMLNKREVRDHGFR